MVKDKDIMEEYDDDVIFCNSPLYKHLSEVNAGNLNDETCQNVVEQSSMRGQRRLETFVKKYKVTTWKDYCIRILSCMGTLLKCVLYYKTVQCEKAGQIYSRYYTYLICTSKSLEEDDLLFVEQLLGDEVYKNEAIKPPSSKTWLCVVAVSLISIMVAIKIFNLWTLYPMLWVVFLTLYLGVLCQIAVYCSCHEECLRTIEIFLEQKHLMKSLMQKCIRLIQELELVARGFTLINSQLPISRLETLSSSRQGLALRRLLFAVAKNTMLKFRQQTLIFISTYPICPDLDSSDLYMSAIPMAEFGRSLDNIEEDELEELTDGYSLAALKSITQLCNLQMSEFIRRLVINLSMNLHKKFSTNFILLIKNVNVTLLPLAHSLQEDLACLERCSKLHKNAFCTHPDRKTLPESDSNFPMAIAVHSLGLHLQSALARINSLEDQLAVHSDSLVTSHEKEMTYQSQLEQIRQSFLAAEGCLEEATSLLKRLISDNSAVKKTEKVQKIVCPQPLSTSPGIAVFDLPPVVQEDQVFEAFTADTVNTEFGDEICDVPDTEQNKTQNEVSQHVLQELKSVLSVRAAEWKEREKQAKKRAGIAEDHTTDMLDQNIEFSNLNKSWPDRNVYRPGANSKAVKVETLQEILDNGNDGAFSSQLSSSKERDVGTTRMLTSNIAALVALKSKKFQMKLDTYDAIGEAPTHSSSDPEEG